MSRNADEIRAASRVLEAAGYTVHTPKADDGDRPLCCGRTFLAVGLVEDAKSEAQRTLDALRPFVERGVPVVGLEPSCLLTLRDEFTAMLPGEETDALAGQAKLLEEFLAERAAQNDLAVLHGHCHQKAFAAMSAVETVLRLVPDLNVRTIPSSCCGMAGAFGYDAENYDISMKMAELSLLPAVRETSDDTLVVADGTSCRHQISDGANRRAVHVVRVLEAALP